MDRKISLNDVRKAVEEAYETYKTNNEGSIDPRVEGRVDKSVFGISAVLTDGTVINAGATDTLSALGAISRVPVAVVLLGQNTPDQLAGKSCSCSGAKCSKPKLPVSAHGVRAISAVAPQGDREGKMDIIVSNLESLLGAAPVLDDKLYEKMAADAAAANAVNSFADAGYELYDDAATSIDIYLRLRALQATVEQVATMGATVAADGVNPKNSQGVFDGNVAANVVSLLARGVRRCGRAWMMEVGLPAKSSFGGLILAVMPGFGAIAAYSPLLDADGISVKAAKAIKYIANTLQLNVYASARVDVVQ